MINTLGSKKFTRVRRSRRQRIGLSKAIGRLSVPMLLATFTLVMQSSTAVAGRYAASFLDIGVGARGLGLGGAYIALARSSSAFYWNPAGLAFVREPHVAFMYASQFGSITDPLAHYNHIGATLPLPADASIGVNWIRLASDQIPMYPELEGDNLGQRLRDPQLRPTGEPIGYFSDQENAYFFTFSKMNRFDIDWGYETLDFPVEMPIGINLKLLQQHLYNKKASGVGIDIGVMLRLGVAEMFNNEHLGKFSFGFQFKDISKTTLTWSTRRRDEVQPSYRWGFAYEQPMNFLHGMLAFTWQNRARFDEKVHFGAELSTHALFLRIGSDDGNFTAGTGLSFWKVSIDYAIIGYDLGNVHRLSGDIRL